MWISLKLGSHPSRIDRIILQDNRLSVGWIVPTWVFDLAHHLHAQYLLNLIWKSDLKSDLIGGDIILNVEQEEQ
jgi:hypothetical protein